MKIEEMIAKKNSDCCGCEACKNICPKNAISMVRDAEGFAYPKINPELCIKCGRCDATCPSLNFNKKIPVALPKTFTATYPDDKILRHSASGAVFTALSEIILKNGGVVFGASFDKNWSVFHTAAHNLDELENLRGSKYVQSKIGDVYRQVKEALKSTTVLFSGTPCQCAGLKSFLGGDSDNLLTTDIICHGVPSPAVWENYIDELCRRNEVKHVNFRSKRKGWSAIIEINYCDRGHYIRNLSGNLYGKLFLSGLISRPSCSSCKFKIPNGQSDLTIGDAWGVKKFAPNSFDSRGTSLVFIHTAKGKKFFEQANLKTQQVEFSDATAHNLSALVAEAADLRREKFFVDFDKDSDKFAAMEKYYYENSEEISKKVQAMNRDAYRKNLKEMIETVRRQFEKNILVVANPSDELLQSEMESFFTKNFPNCGIYILTSKEKQIACKEIFSSEIFKFNDFNELSEFIKNFKLAYACVERPLNWGTDDFINWLKNSGLQIQFFAKNA